MLKNKWPWAAAVLAAAVLALIFFMSSGRTEIPSSDMSSLAVSKVASGPDGRLIHSEKIILSESETEVVKKALGLYERRWDETEPLTLLLENGYIIDIDDSRLLVSIFGEEAAMDEGRTYVSITFYDRSGGHTMASVYNTADLAVMLDMFGSKF